MWSIAFLALVWSALNRWLQPYVSKRFAAVHGASPEQIDRIRVRRALTFTLMTLSDIG